MAHQPKAYKKFVATAATATLVASAIAPVASAATPNFTDVSKAYQDAVNYLVENGIANGTTETTFGTSNNISRGDAAVMIANALKLDTENAKDAGFQDVNARVAGSVNAIVEAGIASGKTATAFDPAAYITRQEMAKMLANAYKLTAKENANFKDVNNNWIGYVSALKEAGITLGKTETTFAPTENLTRGEFALFMFRAEGGEEVIPADPKVVSVSAVNGKQLVVQFNKAVDDSTLYADDWTVIDGLITVTELKKADGTNSTTVTANNLVPTLSEDGKSVTLTAAGNEVFNGKYTIAVNKGVKDFDGKDVPAFSTIIDVVDNKAPSLSSAQSVARATTKSVILTFDEPVQASGVIVYIDGAPASVSRPQGLGLDQLVVTSGTDLKAGTNYELSLLNVKDYSGNFIATNPYKTTFTVTEDVAAPVVQSVTVKGENKVEVVFDKIMNQSSFLNNARLLDSNGVLQTLFTASVSGNKVTLTSNQAINYGPNGTFTGNLLIGSEVSDNLGNKLGSTYTQSVTFTKDTAAPQVASVTYKNNKVTVTFNENIAKEANTLANASIINNTTGAVKSLGEITIGDDEGNAKISGKTLVIPATLNAGDYTLRLPANVIKDTALAGNKNVATVNSFEVKATSETDTAAPTFVKVDDEVTITKVGTNADLEQTVSYKLQDSSGIDLASVRDVNNYTLDGKALPIGTYVTTDYSGTDSAQLTVTLHIPSNKITETKNSYKLVISNVKDKAGNYASPQVSEDFNLSEGVKPELKSAVLATGDTSTVVLSFSEAVNLVDNTDFEIKLNSVDVSSAATVSKVTAGSDIGKYYVSVATAYDAVAEKVYVDLNGNNILDEDELVLQTDVATEPTTSTVNFNASYVNGLSIKVLDGSDIKDESDNLIVKGTKITIR